VWLYGACLLAALLLPAGLVAWTGGHPWVLSTLLLAPLALRPIRTLARSTDPDRLNPLLASTGRLLVLWSLLFSIGWNL
jgi:1,4-dihydroxy-2-naphthoate octaprenyltransferase